jgi:hypothetical protein
MCQIRVAEILFTQKMNVDSMINKEDESVAIEVLEGLKKPFLSRVNEISIVHSISNQIQQCYEITKNTNDIIRYSAESIESVVKKGRPVLKILDKFACDQLDRVELMYRDRRLPKMVGTVGATMGMLSLETIKALRYCLQYLQHAISTIGDYVTLLQHSIDHQYTSTTTSLQL